MVLDFSWLGVMRPVSSYAYEPDETPKRKHHWDKDEAGFDEDGAGFVGKCPTSITIPVAQELLDGAIPWFPARGDKAYPQRLYAIRKGVLYRATPTNPGRSYHGFPEHYSRFVKGTGSRELREQLLTRARTEGCEQELREWMKW